MKKEIKTDWDSVSGWYDAYIEGGKDTLQEKVIAPNLIRLLDIKNGLKILDVGCGQGYFARMCAQGGAKVTGIDQSKELIAKAIERKSPGQSYIVGNAEKIDSLGLGEFDRVYCVLALENIKNINAVLAGVSKSLKKNGTCVLVLLHPAFRIPKHTDWGYDMKRAVQYRKVDRYLSEVSIPIELSPFKNKGENITTHTFHRSLQTYMKAFRSAGLAITAMEEWISHKKSQPGPRQAVEDNARKEFPMFLALELKKI